MLGGFNTNIRHRGTLFHVQTEDSGRAHPHIITHLYFRGTILASEKSSYADELDASDLPGVVKKRMEEQHRTMLQRLREGAYDAVIAERLGGGGAASEAADSTGSTTQPEAAAPKAPQPAPAPAAPGRVFGQGVVSDKPLDEVVLEYLVENARKRRRSGG